jgi:two-component system, cell cycle sensor histidine kinase and response regulator CckA
MSETKIDSTPLSILLLEDNAADAELCLRQLRQQEVAAKVDIAKSPQEFRDLILSRFYDIVLTDFRLPSWNGLDAFHWLRSIGRDIPVILVTGTLGDELAIDCIKAGISDYVLKEHLERLPHAVRRVMEEHRVRNQRDRAEAELRASEEQYRLLFNANPHPMWVFDRETLRFLMVNEAATRQYGYSQREFLSMTLLDIRPPEEADKFLAAIRPTRASHQRELFKHRRKDGTVLDVEVSSQIITFRAIEATLVLAHDVTAQRRAEEQLRLSELRYRAIVERAPYGILGVDENGRIAMANPALIAMLGYGSEQELLEGSSQGIYSDPKDEERIVGNSWDTQGAVSQDMRWVRKDKREIIVRLAGRRLPNEDGSGGGGYEMFVEDVTEARSLQKQFEHAQRMEAIGRLAGGVAHDFNNLLMVISGYAQLVQESPGETGLLAEYVEQIRQASTKASAITRQLLAFSRKQVIEPTLLDVNSVLKDLGKMLPRLLGEDIRINMELQPNLGIVRADRTQIEQVVMNLAVNARDAMPSGGRLLIETGDVEMPLMKESAAELGVPAGRYISLAVTDVGSGMDAETKRHLFEPFYTTKEVGRGTGLGLATVYGIVKQNQGRIVVHSEVGKGSRFEIYLPCVEAAASPEHDAQVGTAPGGKETILLVEDDAILRKVTRVYLQSKGYTVLEAGNTEEALRILTSEAAVRLLLTDLVMAGPGGLELAQSAVALRPKLPVVIISGYWDRSLQAGSVGVVAEFLQKPFSLDKLARIVRSHLNREEATS